MIKIPQDNNIYRVNPKSDLVPNISSVHNMIFDETGYIKLSPPMLTIANEDDFAAFNEIGDMFNYANDEFKIITGGSIYDYDLSQMTLALDASAPSGDEKCRVAGFNATEFIMGTANDVWEYDDPTWTQRNSQAPDFFTEFPSRSTWVGAVNGNDVNQYARAELDDSPLSTTSTGPDLELPLQFQITGLAYSNYQIGVATKHENYLNSATFFVWDGRTTSASIGVPVDAPEILEVVAYQNSWAVLTSRGELLHFNGGGWDKLGAFPPYFLNETWIDVTGSNARGRIMVVDGERIYLNIGSATDGGQEDTGILRRFPSGIWCYEPAVGLYHRHGLASSRLIEDSPTLLGDVYTATITTDLVAGDVVIDQTTAQLNKKYYAIPLTATTFSLADSYDNAVADTPVTTTAAGTGSKEWVKRFDWTQLNYDSYSVFVKKFDNSIASATGREAFFAGARPQQQTTASIKDSMMCLCNNYTNIGNIEYYKIKSNVKEDIWKSITVKYKTLTDGDEIRVKYKIKDSFKKTSIGSADDATPSEFITWVDSTSFTFEDTDYDGSFLSVGDEVTFESGAGAGSTAHIVSTALATGIWTIVIDEEIRGGVVSNTSTVSFDTYQLLRTINKETVPERYNVKTIPLGKSSKWLQVKLELRGNNIAIEELMIDNQSDNPAN